MPVLFKNACYRQNYSIDFWQDDTILFIRILLAIILKNKPRSTLADKPLAPRNFTFRWIT